MFDVEIMNGDGTPLNVGVLVDNQIVAGTLVCEQAPPSVMKWNPDLHSNYSDDPIAVRFKARPGQTAREET